MVHCFKEVSFASSVFSRMWSKKQSHKLFAGHLFSHVSFAQEHIIVAKDPPNHVGTHENEEADQREKKKRFRLSWILGMEVLRETHAARNGW